MKPALRRNHLPFGIRNNKLLILPKGQSLKPKAAFTLIELLVARHPKPFLSSVALREGRGRRKATLGFTLIELLVVMAIIGVLATAVIVAINPNKRLAQARDAQRKTDISAIANALVGYYALTGNYPNETNCDTSIGYKITAGCTPPLTVPLSNWLTTARIYLNLVTDQAFLKSLPKDPTNNNTYYYSYEPRESVSDTFCGVGQPCDYYWIGTLLENPTDPLKPIFRCSDYPISITPEGPGCKEVSDQLSDETPDDI